MPKKKKKGASHWTGYDEEQKKQYDMQFNETTKTTEKRKSDNGFFGHMKKQTLF